MAAESETEKDALGNLSIRQLATLGKAVSGEDEGYTAKVQKMSSKGKQLV